MKRRDLCRVGQGARLEDRSPISRALVVGISEYPREPLPNARGDAEALARLLERDFGFELVGGGPLLDRDASRSRIEAALARLFEDTRPWDQCLVYFAGHGTVLDGRGFLVPVDGESRPRARGLALASVIDRLEHSPARGLLVLDACYAGRALQAIQLDPRVELDAEDPRGGLHLLAAGGPHQPVPDGIEGGHSPFTAALLRGLDGRAGWHDDSGAVPIGRMIDRLAVETEALSQEMSQRTGMRIVMPDVIAETLRASVEGRRGQVALSPRHPRLSSELVAGLRDRGHERPPEDRRALIDQWADAFARETQTIDRLAWHLPLAFDLLLDGLRDLEPAQRADHDSPPLARGLEREPEKADPRAATARVLAVLRGRARELLATDDLAAHVDPVGIVHLRAESAAAREGLVHLALRDPDPIVRWLAGRGLSRTLGDGDRSALRDELEPLGRHTERPVRRRVRTLEAHLGARPLRRLGNAAIHGARRAWRTAWSRRLAKVAMLAVGLVYALVVTTYHVDTHARRSADLAQRAAGLRGGTRCGRGAARHRLARAPPGWPATTARATAVEPLVRLARSDVGPSRRRLARRRARGRPALAARREGSRGRALAWLGSRRAYRRDRAGDLFLAPRPGLRSARARDRRGGPRPSSR